MNRRAFIRSFGALAAAVVAGPVLAKLPATDLERLIGSMETTRLIEGQTFYFSRPVTIAIMRNLTIRRCDFIFDFTGSHLQLEEAMTAPGFQIGECENVVIESSRFEVRRPKNVFYPLREHGAVIYVGSEYENNRA